MRQGFGISSLRYTSPVASTNAFSITRPGTLIALALVTAMVALGAAWKVTRRRVQPPTPPLLRSDPNAKPPQIIDTKDPLAPLPIGATFGRIELHPRLGAGWVLAADDAIAGDLLVAAEPGGFQVRDRGDIAMRGGAKLRAWLAGDGPVFLLEQGEIALDTRGPIELRAGRSTIRATADAVYSARLSATLSVACLRGRIEIDGHLLEAEAIAEIKDGVVSVSKSEVTPLFKWVEEARAAKK